MESRLVYVQLGADADGLKYGFRTTIDESKGLVLGHALVSALNAVNGLVIGANSPKPKRAAKRFAADGIVSSFIAASAIATAKAAGWKVGRNKPNRRGTNTGFSRAVYVTVNSVKYAWKMPASTYAGLGAAKAQLGILDATASMDDLVWGCSFPKPGKAIKSIITGDEVVTVSSFVDPSVDALPADFSLSRSPRIALADI